MGDHAYPLNRIDALFDPELDRLIVRFEGLMRVSRLLEQRGASRAELDEHRLELERVSRQLAGIVARSGNPQHGPPRPGGGNRVAFAWCPPPA